MRVESSLTMTLNTKKPKYTISTNTIKKNLISKIKGAIKSVFNFQQINKEKRKNM